MDAQTYDEYWLGYLAGHSKPLTRWLHYFGLFFGQIIGLALSFFVIWWAFFIVGPVSYFIAFISHEAVEHNTNEPFKTKPLWSVISFFRLMLLDMTGNLGKEMARLK